MEKTLSAGCHRTTAQRAQILTDYRRSGLTQKAFAAQVGIGHSTLTLWLRQATAGESAGSPTFVPVPNLLPVPRAATAYRLQFPRGLTVEVAPGFDAEELSALLQVAQRL
jgi:transposase-like protein